MAKLRIVALAILPLVLAFAPVAAAATYTLANPAVGGFWDDPSTWLKDGVPATTPPQTGDTVQLTGTGTVTVRTNTNKMTVLQQNCACTLYVLPAPGASISFLNATITAGTLRITGTVGYQDSFTTAGTMVLEGNGFFSWHHADGPDPKGVFTNTGTIRKEGGGQSAVYTDGSSSGSIEVTSGRLSLGVFNFDVTGSVSVSSGAELVARNVDFGPTSSVTGDGTVTFENPFVYDYQPESYNRIAGTFDPALVIVRGDPILHFPANYVLTTDYQLERTPRGAPYLRATGTLTNTETFTVTSFADFREADFVNSGTMVFPEEGRLRVIGSVQLVSGGEIRLEGGSLDAHGGYIMTGGSVTGTGALEGASITNSGATLDPGIGSDPGRITLATGLSPGDYTQSGSGRMSVLLAGTEPGTGYDQIVKSQGRVAQLGGTLDVQLDPGFGPVDGDVFDIFTFSRGFQGDFAVKNLPSRPGVTFTAGPYTPPGETLPTIYRVVAHVGPVPAPDLVVSSSVSPASASVGENVVFTITVTNDGSLPSGPVTLTNNVNGGTVVESSSTEGSCSGSGPVVCSLGTLAQEQTVTVTIVATRATAGSVSVTSTATTTGETNTANNSDSETATFSAGADLGITKSGPAGVQAGSTFSYEITVSNDGPVTATGVIVFDTTPDNLTFVSNTGDCTTPFPCNLGSLAEGETRTIEARYTVTGGGDRVTNTATVSSGTEDPRPSNNTATARTDVIACATPSAPAFWAPAQVTAGAAYGVFWTFDTSLDQWEIDESTSPDFSSGVTTRDVDVPSAEFMHDTPGIYYYRVHAIASCNGTRATSAVRRVIVTAATPNEAVISALSGATATLPVEVEGFDTALPYTATTDAFWLAIGPDAGTLPPEGLTLEATVNPGPLRNGTHIATVTVTTSAGARRIPVVLHVVTAMREVTPLAPRPTTVVIPTVGHLRGVNSHWQSDVRIANAHDGAGVYAVTLISGTAHETIITVLGDETIALDDIAANWFGIGVANNDGSGMLQITPLNGAPAPIVTSRTYNVAANGTLGQGIPAVPGSDFIGNDGAVLTLQQITQSAAFRTNVGVVEGFGAPVTVELRLFDGSGTLIRELAVDLAPFQQLQSNALLAGTTVDNGRIEVRVTGGNGRITAYASVIDNQTQDPLFVSGTDASEVRSNRYVFAGAADIVNSSARWRTDLRLYNAGLAAQTATMTFRPFSGPAVFREVTVQPGQVQALDSVLRQTFGIGDTGGAIHITTATESNLVVSGRTYNQTDRGTYGQYIPAFLPEDEATAGGVALQLLHVEDSPRYRSNLGIAETRGANATVEIVVTRGDGTVVDTIQMGLAGYEFRQFRIIKDRVLGDLYNLRITVRVLDGNGAVVAYVSLVDNDTQDPTYIAAQ